MRLLVAPEGFEAAAVVEHRGREGAVLEVGVLGTELIDVVALGLQFATRQRGQVGAAVDIVVLVAAGLDGDADALAAGVLLQRQGGLVLEAEEGQAAAAVIADGLQQVATRRAGAAEHVGPLALHVEPQHGGIGQDAHLGPEPELPADEVGEGEVAVAPPAAQAHGLVGFAVGDGEMVEF